MWRGTFHNLEGCTCTLNDEKGSFTILKDTLVANSSNARVEFEINRAMDWKQSRSACDIAIMPTGGALGPKFW